MKDHTNDPISPATQLIHDGDTHRNNGQGLAAVEAYSQALGIATKAGEWDSAATAQHMIGVAYKVENDIDSALAELQKAPQLYRQAGDPDGAGRVARDIGIAYDYRHEYAKGEPWLMRSIEELSNTTNLPELGISESKLGLHYLYTGHLGQAGEWINRGLATIRRGSPQWFYEMTTLLHRAALLITQHQPKSAIRDLQSALVLINQNGKETTQQRRLAQIYGLLAQAQLRLGDNETARADYTKAQTLLKTMPPNVAAAVREDIGADALDRALL